MQQGRSRVHFNANDDEEAEPTVNVASFDPDGSDAGDDGKVPMTEMPEKDSTTKDITEVKAPSSFFFDDNDDWNQDIRSTEDQSQINRFLRFKSPSAPSSPQPSPLASPELFPQHRDSDIPLLTLSRHTTDSQPKGADSRPSTAGTIIEHYEKRHSMDEEYLGKKEADRLVREHTRRRTHGPANFFRRLSPAEGLRSGASTPDEDHFSKQHYTFNSGVLTNLLKLLYPPWTV